jgi:comEA protein
MLDLTPSEKRTIFVITGVITLAGIFYTVKPYHVNPVLVDYSESDSMFSRLSHQPTVRYNLPSERLNGINQKDQSLIKKRRSTQILKAESIDINHANLNELQKLPRIGPAMAGRIIEYRNTNGPFKSLEELKQIKGIGKKTFEKMKPYLRPIR